MISRKTIACVLMVILVLSIIPALSECTKCGRGGCYTSQFSFKCRYNCECHGSSGSYYSPSPTVMPDFDVETDVFIPETNVHTALSNEIVRQVNAERVKYGLKPLRIDSGLTEAAYIRANEITGKFSHTRPDGSSWRTVSDLVKGENIARGYNTADKVMAAWLTSEGHRANILREGFGSIGVCAIEYNGVIYWVQLFGK